MQVSSDDLHIWTIGGPTRGLLPIKVLDIGNKQNAKANKGNPKGKEKRKAKERKARKGGKGKKGKPRKHVRNVEGEEPTGKQE